MAEQKNTKDLAAWIIAGLVLVSFSLLAIDSAVRFKKINTIKNGCLTIFNQAHADFLKTKTGTNKYSEEETQKGLDGESLEKLIQEYMRGEIGG